MPRDRVIVLLAFLFAGCVTAVTIRQATFAAAFTDPAGYLNQARGFLTGQHVRPVPLALRAFWRFRLESTTSLAARGDLNLGTEVGMYPLGNPVLIAAFQRLGGELAGYLVAPVALGVLTGCGFVLARRLAGATAGFIAALIVATCPAFVFASVSPMSDVPAAAFWALALVMALGETAWSAAAAGGAVAMATMIRPQMALLACVPAYIAAMPAGPGAWRRPSEWRWRSALLFSVFASAGPAVLAWSQAVLYGSPLTPGYPGPGTYFSRAYFWTNLRMYPRLLVEEHSPALLLGLFAAPWWRRLAPAPDRSAVRGRLVSGLVIWVALNLGAYVFYLPFDEWAYLRFMAPALVALAVLFAACAVWIGGRLAEGNPRFVPYVVTAALAAVPLVAVYAHARDAIVNAPEDRREMAFGRYLAEALPRNALVVTFLHAASVVYYTGRPIVRYDYLDPPEFDRVVEVIEQQGYVPYLLLEDRFDTALFQKLFPNSDFSRLDWPPRAMSDGAGPLVLRALDDRRAYAAGRRWPVDVIGYLTGKN